MVSESAEEEANPVCPFVVLKQHIDRARIHMFSFLFIGEGSVQANYSFCNYSGFKS